MIRETLTVKPRIPKKEVRVHCLLRVAFLFADDWCSCGCWPVHPSFHSVFYCREPGVMVFFLFLIYLQVLHWQSAPNDGKVKALRGEKGGKIGETCRSRRYMISQPGESFDQISHQGKHPLIPLVGCCLLVGLMWMYPVSPLNVLSKLMAHPLAWFYSSCLVLFSFYSLSLSMFIFSLGYWYVLCYRYLQLLFAAGLDSLTTWTWYKLESLFFFLPTCVMPSSTCPVYFFSYLYSYLYHVPRFAFKIRKSHPND